jgi:hypothetical protein
LEDYTMKVPPRLDFHLPVLALVVMAGLLCCDKVQAQDFLPSREEHILADHQAIRNWLQCEECTPAQLQAVVRLGQKAVPFLTYTLQQGPSYMERISLTRFLQRRYAEILEYKASYSKTRLPLSEREYIIFHVSQLETQYQIRAATALGAIGGPSAKIALEQSLDQELSEVVRRVVKEALPKGNTPTP